ncbi:MAG: hypothetical protein A2V52_00350 [Actinobacteria bacterium RBG_19FT_COMBO_54_7]|uniref:Prepilin-type N-terminal cleavage/methylation domain-containing protein n=1 Tax=Candidatus Solincola sediminis TaxID=1797199 RepID=A0A1F2WRC7_9ACTN|nr:MAG: hypothetical protein A2Y75_11320 [Candidatus Solincola sediminis]OFW60215.1 MAG: hypothetical protein A2W01_08740 [Candidatus Solincola sediminis]OFW66947.1 MAG: hypothetical protein A2V52_00350 [Actinobacteria bacterium RBG_19FT_COMBO_54_7]
MLRQRSHKRDRSLTGAGLRPFHGVSLIEFLVVLSVMAALVGMALPVWSNIRNNAYDARARQNYEQGEEAVKRYWASQGRKEGDYKHLTAAYMQSLEFGTYWVELNTASLEEMEFDQVPRDYFAAILILHDDKAVSDEILIATISENGKLYYTRFKKVDIVETGELAFSQLKAGEGEHLQATMKTGFGTE